jgi:hypothetical protein
MKEREPPTSLPTAFSEQAANVNAVELTPVGEMAGLRN